MKLGTATYRGRFAPSPTGAIHVGTAQSALLGWLRARQCGGQFILRMEDLDGPRVKTGAAEAILEDLYWLGIDWDEGPDVGGPHGPYTQSACLARYAQALETLKGNESVYPCTCSRKEIAAIASAPHGDEGPIYPGTCRLGPRHPERKPAWRFNMPEPSPSFVDGFHGDVSLSQSTGDFVVARKDGIFAYQLAVVVDDAAMGITEVVRGDDLLSSTPRQIALYQALDLHCPDFVHVPLLVESDGRRFAKRDGSLSIAQLREDGWSADSVIGRLAWGCGLVSSPDPIRAEALVRAFDLARIPHRPTRWEP